MRKYMYTLLLPDLTNRFEFWFWFQYSLILKYIWHMSHVDEPICGLLNAKPGNSDWF